MCLCAACICCLLPLSVTVALPSSWPTVNIRRAQNHVSISRKKKRNNFRCETLVVNSFHACSSGGSKGPINLHPPKGNSRSYLLLSGGAASFLSPQRIAEFLLSVLSVRQVHEYSNHTGYGPCIGVLNSAWFALGVKCYFGIAIHFNNRYWVPIFILLGIFNTDKGSYIWPEQLDLHLTMLFSVVLKQSGGLAVTHEG